MTLNEAIDNETDLKFTHLSVHMLDNTMKVMGWFRLKGSNVFIPRIGEVMVFGITHYMVANVVYNTLDGHIYVYLENKRELSKK